MIRLWIVLMFATCFTLATALEPQFEQLRARSAANVGVMEALLGDSRRLFANHFFTEADAYFHSGFYPGIFDAPQAEEDSHLTHHDEDKDHGHEDEHHEQTSSFLKPPVDWIERFGRQFIPTHHTHLEGENAREILPWLRLSADMDPKRVQTYVTASWWLRSQMNRPAEAEAFLREGLRANPDSYEILFELGNLYDDDKKEPRTAHNIYAMAIRRWNDQDAAGLKPDPHVLGEILGGMIRADEKQNDLKNQLVDLEALVKVTPSKDSVQASIDQLKAKIAGPHGAK